MRSLLHLSCLVLLLFPALVRAEVAPAGGEAPPVIFSEIAWAGSSASLADEWFELFNPGESEADIGGWFVEGAASGGAVLEIPAGSLVPAGGTFLVANYSADDERSVLAVSPDWVTTAVSLSNGSSHLVLRDATGHLVDEAGMAGEAPFAGSSSEPRASMTRVFASMARSGSASWTTSMTSSGFDAGAPEFGTPGTYVSEDPTDPEPGDDTPEDENEEDEPPSGGTASPLPPMAGVKISEVFPAPPTGEKEWIELVNISSTGEFLDGWTIEDGSGKATPLSGLLLPWKRIVVESPKGALNNGGDLVWLRDAHGRTVDGVSFGSWEDGRFRHVLAPPKGASIMRAELGEEWSVTLTPTKGGENRLTEEAGPNDAVSPSPPAATVESPSLAAPERPFAAPPPAGTMPAGAAMTTSAASTTPAAVSPESLRSSVPKGAKPSAPKTTASSSRYKGRSYVATVAVPPGVFSSARLRVLVEGSVRELRLSRSPSEPYAAGEVIGFVAQEKSDGSRAYLLANLNSVHRTGRTEEFDFIEAGSWPAETGPIELTGIVTEISGRSLVMESSGKKGLVESPVSLAETGLAPGDRVSVKGFMESIEPPSLVLADADSMRLVESLPGHENRNDERERLPAVVAFLLVVAVVAAGALVRLRAIRTERAELLGG